MAPCRKAPSRRTGNRWSTSPCPRGTRTASSGSSSTGDSIRCPHSATSGIRATCTRRAHRSLRITWRRSARSPPSGTRTSSRNSRPNDSIPRGGLRCSRRRVLAMWFRSRNTTTASPCTTARSPTGVPPRWGPSAMSSANCPKPCARRALSSACRHTARSTGGSSTRASCSIPTFAIRNTPRSTGRR